MLDINQLRKDLPWVVARLEARKTIDRAKAILMTPRPEWEVIDGEPLDLGQLLVQLDRVRLELRMQARLRRLRRLHLGDRKSQRRSLPAGLGVG